jgi:hypothetical protein
MGNDRGRHHPARRCGVADGGRGIRSGDRIFAASIGALEALLSIGGTHPWWSLAIFALCLWILQGLFAYRDDEPAPS